jgi:hypothetical protein
MTEQKRTFTKTLKDYFGIRPGDALADFAKEIQALSDEDKVQLADGIEDGTLTY